MITAKELQQGLDMAAASGKNVNFKDKFIAAPQLPEGKSRWAKWVAAKKLQPTDVIWAFIDGDKKSWLAARVQFKGETIYFNLQNDEDRALMKRLESDFSAENDF